jgi:hypothetical protein
MKFTAGLLRPRPPDVRQVSDLPGFATQRFWVAILLRA